LSSQVTPNYQHPCGEMTYPVVSLRNGTVALTQHAFDLKAQSSRNVDMTLCYELFRITFLKFGTTFALQLQIRMLSYIFWTFLMRTIIWKAKGLQESAKYIVIWVTQQYKTPACFAHSKYGILHTTRVNSCVATLRN
jgi:hypothetical protein